MDKMTNINDQQHTQKRTSDNQLKSYNVSEAIDVVMQDLGDAWDVKHVPKHKI